MAITLVINPGSSSRKYALLHDGKSVLELAFEGTGTGYEMCMQKRDGRQTCEPLTVTEFQNAFKRVEEAVSAYCTEHRLKLSLISIRVVAPGTVFAAHRVIDAIYLAQLHELEPLAPLHIPLTIHEIEACHATYPGITVVGVSDSAFHSTLPSVAKRYSIKTADAAELDIYRFGYHGLSVGSVAHRVHAVIGIDPKRTIVCHVGGGVSVTALKDGVSIETSMGYLPLGGLPMGSRGGDLDPGAVLALMQRKKLRLSEMTTYLHKQCGLAGLAGEGDIRHLLERRARGEVAAAEALNIFMYHIQKEIAGATAALQGIDALVFTGTAAQRSSELRSLITNGLGYLGITLNADRNDVLVGKEGVISPNAAEVKVVVMRTDEMREIAVAAELLTQSK